MQEAQKARVIVETLWTVQRDADGGWLRYIESVHDSRCAARKKLKQLMNSFVPHTWRVRKYTRTFRVKGG